MDVAKDVLPVTDRELVAVRFAVVRFDVEAFVILPVLAVNEVNILVAAVSNDV